MKQTHLDWRSGFLQLTAFFNERSSLNEYDMYALGEPHSMFNPRVVCLLPVFEPATAVETHSLISLACRQSQTLNVSLVFLTFTTSKLEQTDVKSLSCRKVSTQIQPGISDVALCKTYLCSRNRLHSACLASV
jgi:hypothetical protein